MCCELLSVCTSLCVTQSVRCSQQSPVAWLAERRKGQHSAVNGRAESQQQNFEDSSRARWGPTRLVNERGREGEGSGVGAAVFLKALCLLPRLEGENWLLARPDTTARTLLGAAC